MPEVLGAPVSREYQGSRFMLFYLSLFLQIWGQLAFSVLLISSVFEGLLTFPGLLLRSV